MENIYNVRIKMSREESQSMKHAVGRDWHMASVYFYNLSEKLSKTCGFEVNIYPSAVGDVDYCMLTIESKSLSALSFADEHIRHRILNNWEE